MTDAGRTCVVADDHPALRMALGDYLAERGYHVVATAANGLEVIDRIRELNPRFAIVDYRMPKLAGTELIGCVAEVAPETHVIVYTADADGPLVVEALAAGARAVLLKEAPLADLVRAMEAVDAGALYIDAALSPLASVDRAERQLTPRERQVLALLAEGLSQEDIGNRLAISAETVRSHVKRACARLGVATKTQAVAFAFRSGMIV